MQWNIIQNGALVAQLFASNYYEALYQAEQIYGNSELEAYLIPEQDKETQWSFDLNATTHQ